MFDRNRALSGERTVKRLRLSRAVTVPETTNIKEVCQRMAARRVDALLLTDSNALLCGILTDKVLFIINFHLQTSPRLLPCFHNHTCCVNEGYSHKSYS